MSELTRLLAIVDHIVNGTSDGVSGGVSNDVNERSMSPYHKEKIAAAHRGNRQSHETRKKISRSMAGKSNFEGKRHTDHARDVIGAKRGSDDRIRGRRWIVNSSDKTYRRYHAPGGYKIGRRTYIDKPGKKDRNESIMSFKSFID